MYKTSYNRSILGLTQLNLASFVKISKAHTQRQQQHTFTRRQLAKAVKLDRSGKWYFLDGPEMSLPGHFSRWSSQLQLNITWYRCRYVYRITLLCRFDSTIENFSFFSLSFLSCSPYRSFLFHSLGVFVLRAVNKMHKHTYTWNVWVSVREQLRCFMCAGCSSMWTETLRGARPQTKPHNLHVCRLKRNYSVASFRLIVGFVSHRRDDRASQLVSTSEKIVITSSFIIALCRQTGNAEASRFKGDPVQFALA